MQLGWYLHRLRVMGFAELKHRFSERWKHRSDATFARTLPRTALGAATECVPPLPSKLAAPFGLKARLAADAIQLQAGKWKLFGWRQVQVGTPPLWHQDPVGTYVAPQQQLAHRLNHRALPEGADVRTLWEINRWSELTRLAMHGWLNEDPQAITTAQTWLEDWVQHNPLGYGIHWTSPLEAGLRLINFVWFDALVVACGDEAILARQAELASRIVPGHVAWIWRYLSFGSSANNHLLGELVGLLHAVKRWPSLAALATSPELLWKEIERCVLEQFASDGGNREQALHYHLFAWEMAWHAARIMEVVTGPVISRLEDAADFFAQMVHPAEPWNYGDSDDAEVLPLYLDRHDAEGEWLAWIRGTSSGEALQFWLGAPPPSIRRFASPDTWWTALESGMAVREARGWKIRLDASPLGFGAMAAHGHGDALHVSLWDGYMALLIDPGTGGYYGMKKERAALAAWEAHNSPQPVGGFKTPRRLGAFLLSDHHEPPQIQEMPQGHLLVSLNHEGGLWQRRTGLDENHNVVIEDSVQGPAVSAIRIRWHLAPEVTVEEFSKSGLRLRRGSYVWRSAFTNVLSCTLSEGLVSRRYGSFEKCPVIEVTGQLTIKSVWSRG